MKTMISEEFFEQDAVQIDEAEFSFRQKLHAVVTGLLAGYYEKKREPVAGSHCFVYNQSRKIRELR